MATTRKPAGKTTGKPSAKGKTTTAAKGKTAAKKPAATSRASNEELDAQATEVVRLRDEEDMSWGEVAEETGIPTGRLRALYNRGGGKPTRQRRGSAKAAPKEEAEKPTTRRSSAKTKASGAKTKGKRPS